MLFCHSKSYFDIRTESENRNLTFEILFDIRNESENLIFTFNPVLTFELSRKIVF